MTATYTCIACDKPLPAADAVIVGVDVAGYPERIPTNVLAHHGCEDKARALIRRALADQERGTP
jgi:hypothetical protein